MARTSEVVKAFQTVSEVVTESDVNDETVVTRVVEKCENDDCQAKLPFAVAIIGSEEATSAGAFVCSDCKSSIELDD